MFKNNIDKLYLNKGWIYIDNLGWTLDKPKAILLNLVKSANYYHHRGTVSTRGTEIVRVTSARCV